MESLQESNLSCSLCTIKTAAQCCACADKPLMICDTCVSKHLSVQIGRCHKLFPVELREYYKIPGYLEEYTNRREVQLPSASTRLTENLQRLDEWIDSIQRRTDEAVHILRVRCEKQVNHLQSIRDVMEKLINEGLKEYANTVHEIAPILKTPIAQRIRQYKGLDLVSCQSDIPLVFNQIVDLLETSAIFIQVEMPEILPVSNPQESEPSPLIAVERDSKVTEKLPQPSQFIGQLSSTKTKHGHGQVIFDTGEVLEGQWVDSKQSERGKVTWPDGSFLVGKTKNKFVRDLKKSSFCGRWTKRIFIAFFVLYIARNFNFQREDFSREDCECGGDGNREFLLGGSEGRWQNDKANSVHAVTIKTSIPILLTGLQIAYEPYKREGLGGSNNENMKIHSIHIWKGDSLAGEEVYSSSIKVEGLEGVVNVFFGKGILLSGNNSYSLSITFDGNWKFSGQFLQITQNGLNIHLSSPRFDQDGISGGLLSKLYYKDICRSRKTK